MKKSRLPAEIKLTQAADLLRRIRARLIRALPAASVLLVFSTLVLYLTIGPAVSPFSAPQTANPVMSGHAAGFPNVLSPDPNDLLADDFSGINRGNGLAEWTDPDSEETPEPSESAESVLPTDETAVTTPPAATPIPEATPYPVETDANGVIQEGLPVDDFAPDDTVFYVKAFEANIRKSPRTDAEIVVPAAMGDKLTRTGYGLNWSQVETEKGQTGYVLSSLITTTVIYKPQPADASGSSSKLSDARKQEIVKLAKSCLGVRYVYGGMSMKGFDCSGFTSYVYKKLFGITLPRSARSQTSAGIRVSAANIQIGDIICFDWDYHDGICDHVGLYIGGGQYIHAAHSRGKVVKSTINFGSNPIVSIRRIIH